MWFFSSYAKYRDDVQWKGDSAKRGHRGEGHDVLCLGCHIFSALDLLGKLAYLNCSYPSDFTV